MATPGTPLLALMVPLALKTALSMVLTTLVSFFSTPKWFDVL
jgi:hypothetical protein